MDFQGMSEEEYLEECRKAFRATHGKVCGARMLSQRITAEANSLVAQDARLRGRRVVRLHDAITGIIKEALNVRRMTDIQAHDLPKAGAIADQALGIVREWRTA